MNRKSENLGRDTRKVDHDFDLELNTLIRYCIITWIKLKLILVVLINLDLKRMHRISLLDFLRKVVSEERRELC